MSEWNVRVRILSAMVVGTLMIAWPSLSLLAAMRCIPPVDEHNQRNGMEYCYYDLENKKLARTSFWKDNKEVGPRRTFREDDGTVERVTHIMPNVGAYASDELYYETGGIRRAEFHSTGSQVGIEYKVSGRIQRVWCLPGKNGGYGHSLEECQPKVSFDIEKWRPAK